MKKIFIFSLCIFYAFSCGKDTTVTDDPKVSEHFTASEIINWTYEHQDTATVRQCYLDADTVCIKTRANTYDRTKLHTDNLYQDGIYTWKTYIPTVGKGDMTSIGSWIYCDDQHEVDFEVGYGTEDVRNKLHCSANELVACMTNQAFPYKSKYVPITPGWHEFTIKLDLYDASGKGAMFYEIHWLIDGVEKQTLKTEFGRSAATFRIYVSVENLKFIGSHIASQDNVGRYEWVKFEGHKVNAKPTTVPELRSWSGDTGTRKVGKHPRIKYIDDDTLAKEEYRLEINRRGIKAYASSLRGRKWAESTVLQMAAQYDGKLPCGTAHDWPEYPIRGFVVDAGRMYFPIEQLYRYIDDLVYYKMNTMHIHLNDNGFIREFENDWNKVPGNFRLQSDFFPGLANPEQSYTKQEYIKLQKYAESKGVEIISEFDAPAHSLAFSRYRPELASSTHGPDHLDLFNPGTYSFLDSLYMEFLGGDEPVIRGPRFHAGVDEYKTKDQEIKEQFRHFVNHYLALIESYGKQACSWGSLTDMSGETPVDGNGRMVWAWYNGYADPQEMMDMGFDLISIPDELVYIVPSAGYYNEFLNRELIYKTWTPAHIGASVFEENHPKIKGGMFAEWNDYLLKGYTMEDIHDRVYPATQVIAAKTWSGVHTTFTYDKFENICLSL